MAKTIAKAAVCLMIIAAAAACVAIIYRYTAGFNEDFKTFYIEHNGKKIFTERSKTTLYLSSTERFDVRYTFDVNDGKAKDYEVKIYANVTRDFDYTVAEERYLFSKVKDLTPAFELNKQSTFFEITLPKELKLEDVLSKYHGAEAQIPATAEKDNEYPYSLSVSSYNGKVTYMIDFKTEYNGAVSITLDAPWIVF